MGDRYRHRYHRAGTSRCGLDTPLSTVAERLTCPFTLCLAGGGQDGTELSLAFAESSFPADEVGVLLTGPFCPEPALRRVQAIAAERNDLSLIDFTEDSASLVERATRVVGMAGYNSVCEILSYRKTALLVPREAPRLEQTIRANRFADIGLVDVLSPRDLTPAALTAWMATAPSAPRATSMRFTALEQVPRLVEGLLPSSERQTTPPRVPSTRGTGASVHVH